MSNWIDWDDDELRRSTGKFINNIERAFGSGDTQSVPTLELGKSVTIDGGVLPASDNATWEGWVFKGEVVNINGSLVDIRLTDVSAGDNAGFYIEGDLMSITPPFKVGGVYTLPVDILQYA